MNGPPTGGSHGKLHPTARILSHAGRRGGVAARGERVIGHQGEPLGILITWLGPRGLNCPGGIVCFCLFLRIVCNGRDFTGR